MDFGSMFGQWWEVGHALTGRSKCRNCRTPISKGSLRVGLSSEEHDHGGGSGFGGWLHVEAGCFLAGRTWQSAPDLKTTADLTNFDELSPQEQRTIRDFLSGKTKPTPATNFEALNLRIKKRADGHIEVAGKTFSIKDQLRSQLGARWDPESKIWVCPPGKAQAVMDFFGLEVLGDFSQSPRKRKRESGSERKSEAKSSASSSSARPAKRQTVPRLNNNLALSSFTVAQLKQELKKRVLPVTGIKADLRGRLMADMRWRLANGEPDKPLDGLVFAGADQWKGFIEANGGTCSSNISGGEDYLLWFGAKEALQRAASNAVVHRQPSLHLPVLEKALQLCVPIIDLPALDYREPCLPLLAGGMEAATSRQEASGLTRTEEAMDIHEVKRRTIAVFSITWDAFKEPLVVVERPKCKGGCGFFGAPETGYCSRCRP